MSDIREKSERQLVRGAAVGSLEAVRELERRGWDALEIGRWREAAKVKAEKARAKYREIMAGAKGPTSDHGHGSGDFARAVAKEANEESAGASDTEVWGTVMGGAVRMEGAAGLLPEVSAVWEGSAGSGGTGGIKRELEVIRVGPNPRVLTCRYQELASERVCLVLVKSIKNFVKGMRFMMEEPGDEVEFRAAWKYGGVMPRYRGKW